MMFAGRADALAQVVESRWFVWLTRAGWLVIITSNVTVGVGTTDPRDWLASLATMVFVTALTWQLSSQVAPWPLPVLIVVATLAVAARGWWLNGSFADRFRGWTPFGDLTLVMWISYAILVTGLGITSWVSEVKRSRTSGELIFPAREGRWRTVFRVNGLLSGASQLGSLELVRISRTGRARRGLVGRADQTFYAYGAPLVAPCSGTVLTAVDGLADGIVDSSWWKGNHVIIDNGHEHILLAHLRLGTVAVTTGDQVRSGDAIGQVGSSGFAREPHLYIHAERAGKLLRMRFNDVGGTQWRGRVVSVEGQRARRATT